MRVLDTAAGGAAFSPDDEGIRSDYVYMYPPRQAYRPTSHDHLAPLVARSLEESSDVNIYVHFPFCSQICAYCNLFVAGKPTEDTASRYAEAVIAELRGRQDALRGKRTRTVYLGGGTPSLLTASLLGKVLDTVCSIAQTPLAEVSEISLEVAPETATRESLTSFLSLGINRLNFGLQATDASERASIGRSSSIDPTDIIRWAVSAGFSNVCVDLIYGLEGQTDATWQQSLANAIAVAPHTICTYALTLRPRTGFAAHGYTAVSAETLYRRYEIGREMLLAAGYTQENHVRYVRDSGGYVQKANHWAGQNILGFGAGARSYLKHCDTRNGYSTRHRRETLSTYMTDALAGAPTVDQGFELDRDEQLRRRVILGLFNVDLAALSDEFEQDVLQTFNPQISLLEERQLVLIEGGQLRLTTKGRKFRDNIAQMFFSDRVRKLVEQYDYAD